jgi:hypothetical protein
MPAVSEKQRKFFGAVMGAKKGKKGVSSEARETAKSMSEDSINDFLHKKSAAYLQGFLDKSAQLKPVPPFQIDVSKSIPGFAAQPVGIPTPAPATTPDVSRNAPAAQASLPENELNLSGKPPLDPLKVGLGIAGAGALAYGVYKLLQARKRKKQQRPAMGGMRLQPA